ncbi:MAG: ISL3 family transposase, partial [Flavobacteriales bacterium]|nr:ISL3 family transposase [Flavobacteriales bacterium]
MLGVTNDFAITQIEKEEEPKKVIKIFLKYLPNRYKKDSIEYRLYDTTPEREWQHLSWFDYSCYLVCKLPRYIDSDGKPKVIELNFAPKNKGYTYLFSQKIIEVLQKVRVQKTVADLLQTTAHIVRSVMEQAVENALEERGEVSDFENISLDEKAYAKGHEYATILIDSDKEYIIEMNEGRKEKSVKALFFSLNTKEHQPQIKRVNIDMWKPYMNAMEDIAPQAVQVHDKFHLFKKLSEAIDKTRKQEVKETPLLLNQKYTVLKNAENRTEKQQEDFDKINEANLKTAQAWRIRENFKDIFQINDSTTITIIYDKWIQNALESNLKYIQQVVETFQRHRTGIINAFETKSTSGKHENMNGRIQSVIAKARGFINFDRFRINVLFYFGKLNLLPQKF